MKKNILIIFLMLLILLPSCVKGAGFDYLYEYPHAYQYISPPDENGYVDYRIYDYDGRHENRVLLPTFEIDNVSNYFIAYDCESNEVVCYYGSDVYYIYWGSYNSSSVRDSNYSMVFSNNRKVYNFTSKTWVDSTISNTSSSYIQANSIIYVSDGCKVRFGNNSKYVGYSRLVNYGNYEYPKLEYVDGKLRIQLNEFLPGTVVPATGDMKGYVNTIPFIYLTIYNNNTFVSYPNATLLTRNSNSTYDFEVVDGKYYYDVDISQYLTGDIGDYSITVRVVMNSKGMLKDEVLNLLPSSSYYNFSTRFYGYCYGKATYEEGSSNLTFVSTDKNFDPLDPDTPVEPEEPEEPDPTVEAIDKQTEAIKEQTEVSKNIFQQIIDLPR